MEDVSRPKRDTPNRVPILDQIMTKTGMDLRTFVRAETYKALAIGLVLFSLIAYAGLSVFGLSSSMFSASADVTIDEDTLSPALSGILTFEEANGTVESHAVVDEIRANWTLDNEDLTFTMNQTKTALMSVATADGELTAAEQEYIQDFLRENFAIPIDELEFQTLNRSAIEQPVTNDTGWFQLSEHRGKVVVLDMMAHDCSNCHGVQARLEDKMMEWQGLNEERELLIIGYGSYYTETLEYLNTSGQGELDTYKVPQYPTGLGTETSLRMNGSEGFDDPKRLFTPGATGVIPIVMVIDTEGYIIATEASSTPAQGWGDFDHAIEVAMTGTVEEMAELRAFGVQEVDTSMAGIIFLGAALSILVYFSPCAFPVLPGFISYYITLGAREDELIENGKLKGKMPGPVVIGILSGLGMWTFFAFIGIIAWIMGRSFATSGIIHDIAIFIAALLLILGFFMLTGGTSHLMSWVQKIVDKFSTTEMDDTFTPRRNMYLYGIGYAAASIDCTAAAVLPFIGYLATMDSASAVPFGLGSLMVGLLILMVAVVSLVGFGRQQAIGFLRRATGMIKLIGAWMMMMAGAGLLFYLTNTDVVASFF